MASADQDKERPVAQNLLNMLRLISQFRPVMSAIDAASQVSLALSFAEKARCTDRDLCNNRSLDSRLSYEQ